MGSGISQHTQVFQFTPLREGRRTVYRWWGRWCQDFNSRPCVRGDSGVRSSAITHGFQFTPLREGRPKPFAILRRPSVFQFTPLREGRPLLFLIAG